MKVYLIGINKEYSDYIRDLINKDRIESGDPKIIDQEIQQHIQIIQELKERKRSKPVKQDKIKDLLSALAPNYKRNAKNRSENQRLKFIELSIIPGLKKFGWKGKPEDIDELLLNWPEE